MFYSTEHLFYDAGFGYDAAWGLFDQPGRRETGVCPGPPIPAGIRFRLPALSSSSKFPANGTYISYPTNVKPTYMQQWNLTVQRQLRLKLADIGQLYWQ